jgi:hypothetical protein
MRTFEKLLEEYRMLLEQEPVAAVDPSAGAGPDQAGAGPQPPMPDGAMQQAQQPPQQPAEPSSVGFAVVTQIILDALRVKQIPHISDKKYSDNFARTPQEAWKYLDIVTRNLPAQSQQKAQQDVGKGGDEDLDELNIVDMANLAIKALFFVPKIEESEGEEYSNLANITKVTTENAKQTYNQIREFLSTR